MKDLIEKAQQYILQEPQCKKDIFMGLCSLNYIMHHNSIVYTYAVMVFSLVSTISWKLLK